MSYFIKSIWIYSIWYIIAILLIKSLNEKKWWVLRKIIWNICLLQYIKKIVLNETILVQRSLAMWLLCSRADWMFLNTSRKCIGISYILIIDQEVEGWRSDIISHLAVIMAKPELKPKISESWFILFEWWELDILMIHYFV